MSFGRNFDWFLVDDSQAVFWPSGLGGRVVSEAQSVARDEIRIEIGSVLRLSGSGVVTLLHGDGVTEYPGFGDSRSFGGAVFLDGLSAAAGPGASYLISFRVLGAGRDVPETSGGGGGGGPAPILTSLLPVEGTSLGGTSVTLTGSEFADPLAGGTSVTFNGVAATNVIVVNDTTITCDTPAGPAGTAVDVVVTNANGSDSLVAAYTYYPAPTVTNAVPGSGPQSGGTSITITGTGFTANSPGANTVTIDGNACTSIVTVNDTTITCDTPAGTAGSTFDVVVSNGNGTGTGSSLWSYYPAPTLTATVPSSGPASGGTSITLTGSGFQNNSPGTNTITINGNPCTSVVVVNDTTITCDTPAGTEGTGPFDVVLTNNNGTATDTSAWSYNAAPTVTNVAPSRGTSLGGTSITVTGSGFQNNNPGTNTVTIGGNPCTSVVVVNDTTITCTTPAGTPGTLRNCIVTNNNGSDTLVGAFTYNALPTVASVAPNTGDSAGGESVTITGSGFQNFSPGTNAITFGGTAATAVVVVNDTTITCTTPAHASGLVNVVCTNNNGTSTGTGQFTYLTSGASMVDQLIIIRQGQTWHGSGVWRRPRIRG